MGEPADWEDIQASANPEALAMLCVAWELNEIKTILGAMATQMGCYPAKYMVNP